MEWHDKDWVTYVRWTIEALMAAVLLYLLASY